MVSLLQTGKQGPLALPLSCASLLGGGQVPLSLAGRLQENLLGHMQPIAFLLEGGVLPVAAGDRTELDSEICKDVAQLAIPLGRHGHKSVTACSRSLADVLIHVQRF
jgi:hypothetical protein